MTNKKSYTIHDVAKMSGVSVKTVSRVLNADQQVRASNIIKVNKAIEQLNYKPDINARRLRTKQSYLIAVLYRNYRGNFYSNLLITGAISVCDSLGYDLVVRPFEVGDNALLSTIELMLERSKPDGLLLLPPLCDDEILLGLLREKNIPMVRIAPFNNTGEDRVHCNEVSATKRAIQHLIALGHTRIGFLNFLVGHAAGSWRYEGYQQALAEAGIDENAELVEQHKHSPEIVEQATRRLLTQTKAPTAIFTTNDATAAVVYRIAAQLNKKIPYDLSIIGFDDDPLSENLWPPLTTVMQPITELGKEATTLLIKKFIQRKEDLRPSEPICELLIRSSCGPVVFK